MIIRLVNILFISIMVLALSGCIAPSEVKVSLSKILDKDSAVNIFALDLISNQTVNEGSAIAAINANVHGSDVNASGTPITYTCYFDTNVNGAVADTTACSTIPGLTFTASTGAMNWTPDYTQSGNYEFKVTATDGTESDSDIFTITVNDANRAPVLAAIADQTVNENVAITTIDANDSGSDVDADGETITYSCYVDTAIDGTVANTTACSTISGLTFTASTGVMDWTPSYTQSGTYEFKIVGSDGSLTDDEIFSITVNNVNRAPVIDVIADQTVNEGIAISTIDANDGGDDLDIDGQAITYSCFVDTSIDGAVTSTTACSTISGLTFSTSTGVMNWMPDLTQSGTYEFKIVGSDGTLSDDEIFSITVNNVNQAPVLDTIADQTLNEGVAITTINAGDGGDDLDRDGETITYDCYYDTTIDGNVNSVTSCTSLTGVTFSISTGVMNWTPNTSQSGTYEFIIIGSDGSLTGSEIFSITVNDTNHAPALDAISNQTVDATVAITTIDAGDGGDDFDVDNEALTYTCYYDTNANGTVANTNTCSSLANATFSASTGVFNWTPGFTQVGQYEFKITASDSALTSSRIFTINVNNPPSFVAVYRTPGASTSVTLPMKSGGTFNFTVDWGDGSAVASVTSYADTDKTHVYATAGDYTVTISGQMSSIGFQGSASKDYLIRVINLGSTLVTNLDSAFKDCINLTHFAGGNTSLVTTMASMFYGTTKLVNLDVSSFNTSSVISMNAMFYGASVITTLNLSSFNTTQVADMSYMFSSNPELTSINLSSFNTANATSMYYMFASTPKLTAIDLSSFDTSKVTNMGWMFGASGVTSLDLSHFNTSRVVNMTYMFYGLTNITSLDLSSFDTANVTTMAYMFYSSQKLATLNIQNFDTAKVNSMAGMFGLTSELTTLDLSHFNTALVTNMSGMFQNATKLNSLNISNFNTANVTDMNSMFYATKITSLDLSHFNTAKVTSMSYMFFGTSALSNLLLTNFDTSNVLNMSSMFQNMNSLTTLNVSMFNTLKVTDMSYMFYASKVTNLNLSSFNTPAVTKMNAMFQFITSTSLDISNFNTSSVITMNSMFYSVYNLTSLNLSHFRTSTVNNMTLMFALSPNLISLNTSNWDLTNSSTSLNVFNTTNAGLVVTCNQGGSPATGTFFGKTCN